MKKILLLSLFTLTTLAGHADEGMWMLIDLKEQNAATMYDMGLDISIDKVYCPDSISLKDAVVHFGGGCTGEIISAEHIQDKTFQTTYFCTKINRKVNNKQLLIKPAGLYAIKYIRGSYDDLIKAYAQFVEELHNMNYNVIGALYEEDMLNYLSETDFNYYLMRIEARIL